jgi:Putative transposase
VLTLKTPYRDSTTHIVMSPLEFMQCLAALVPRSRLHLIRFHGVLAPNAKLRPQIIPSAPVSVDAPSAEHGDAPHPSPPTRISWFARPHMSLRVALTTDYKSRAGS